MNKVIIIGGAIYHNSLGLARSFGVNGIAPYGILVGDKGCKWKNISALSKYWAKVWIVKDEEEAISLLLDKFANENDKPVLVPSSDGAALAIDRNYCLLAKYFLVPGIKGKQGVIANLMDKFEQIKWARSLGLDIANAEIITIDEPSKCVTSLRMPVILKPVVSAEGQKHDIRKCHDVPSLRHELEILKNKGYRRILAQEYVEKDYEIELWGSILENSHLQPYLLSKHYREWPNTGGTVCYHEFITDPVIKKQAEEILSKIKACGYIGNIDVELFSVNGALMLNEVNFRNSGDIYACFTNKVFYSYYSYLDMIGEDVSKCNLLYGDRTTAMDENLDLRHLIFGHISIKEWFKDWKRCSDFALFYKGDLKPAFAKYMNAFLLLFSWYRSEKDNIK